jgi:hypothetical protein
MKAVRRAIGRPVAFQEVQCGGGWDVHCFAHRQHSAGARGGQR